MWLHVRFACSTKCWNKKENKANNLHHSRDEPVRLQIFVAGTSSAIESSSECPIASDYDQAIKGSMPGLAILCSLWYDECLLCHIVGASFGTRSFETMSHLIEQTYFKERDYAVQPAASKSGMTDAGSTLPLAYS